MHSRVLPTKESNRLISPSIFSTTRAIDNAQEATGIWLDNDSGGISPEELASIFPDLRMVVFNTFSTTATIKKYRVFIPTDKPMGARVYNIVKEIIRQAAVVNPNHGFDSLPTHAVALFYLPCQARDRQASFFVDYNEHPRSPLNVLEWLEAAVEHRRPPPTQGVQNHAADIEKVKAALSVIPADCDRGEWFEILCALFHELGDAGFALADEWSRTGGSKYDRQKLERQWNDIRRRKPNNPITARTIFWRANEF